MQTTPDFRQDQRLAGTDEWQPGTPRCVDRPSIIDAPRPRRLRKAAGFTMIEMLVGVSVVGALSSVAYPSVESQVLKTRRSDVQVTMMQMQMAQERFRANSATYGSLAEIGASGRSSAGYYTLQVISPDADGYAVLATATGVQSRDTACRYMKLSLAGANASYASGPDALVANSDSANRRCWNL